MQNEVQEYYGVRNGSCHSFTIETMDGGKTWIVNATGEEYKEAWLAEQALENMLMGCGYQVFYSIKDAEEYLREMDREDNPGSDLPQTEETSEERIERYREQLSQPCDETPEEAELLDTVERLIISPGECVYYNGTNYSFRKRSWQDVCLVSHYDEINVECSVFELDQWSRIDALESIRNYRERHGTTV